MGHLVTNQEDPRHGSASRYSGVSESRDRSSIVGKQNAPLGRGPLEDGGVGRRRQAYVPNVYDRQARLAPGQSVQAVPVEVLICEQRDHRLRPFALARASRSSLLGPPGCEASI